MLPQWTIYLYNGKLDMRQIIDPDVIKYIKRFVCFMYGKPNMKSLNAYRLKLFENRCSSQNSSNLLNKIKRCHFTTVFVYIDESYVNESEEKQNVQYANESDKSKLTSAQEKGQFPTKLRSDIKTLLS